MIMILEMCSVLDIWSTTIVVMYNLSSYIETHFNKNQTSHDDATYA